MNPHYRKVLRSTRAYYARLFCTARTSKSQSRGARTTQTLDKEGKNDKKKSLRVLANPEVGVRALRTLRALRETLRYILAVEQAVYLYNK